MPDEPVRGRPWRPPLGVPGMPTVPQGGREVEGVPLGVPGVPVLPLLPEGQGMLSTGGAWRWAPWRGLLVAQKNTVCFCATYCFSHE